MLIETCFLEIHPAKQPVFIINMEKNKKITHNTVRCKIWKSLIVAIKVQIERQRAVRITLFEDYF